MDTDDKHHQSSSFIKQQSNPKLIIKFAGRNIIHQQQCKEAEEEVMMKKKNMSVSKHNLLSISNSPNSISNNSDSSLSPTTCSICGKSFPSKQSLFGHMRSHPEREWRGIQPPPPPPLDQSQSLSVRLFIKKYSPASTDSDDSRKSVESYQGVGPLPINWSNTGKRGRRPYGSFLSSDERIDDAVKGLLMLKEGNGMDAAMMMSKQISRETEGIITTTTTTISKKRKKRMILESSSEDVSRSSDLLRSSKKMKIDQERSCGSSRDGFDPKLISSNNIQSSQLEQLPAAASNMFQEDCGLVKNVSKKVKLADERISCGSSRDVLMNSIPCHLEQLPQGDFSLLKNSSSKKLKLDDERGCSSSSSSMFDPKLINNIQSSHLQQMYSNGCHRDVFDSKLFNGIPPSSHLEQIPTPNDYFQGGFNSVFSKPAILMKATPKKKVKENEKGSSAADQNMGMQVSCYEFKCDTCNRTFPSHQALGGHKSSQRNCKNSNGSSIISYPFDHHQYLQCRESMSAVEQDYITETKIPTMSYTGTHRCEHCGLTFGTGQALGGHKRRHYTGGGLNTSGTVHVNSTTMAQTDQLMVKSTAMAQTDQLTAVAQTDQFTDKSTAMAQTDQLRAMAQTEKLIKKEEMMNRLSVVPVASSVGEEVISTTTVTKTENKAPVLDFDLNEIDLNEIPDESWK